MLLGRLASSIALVGCSFSGGSGPNSDADVETDASTDAPPALALCDPTRGALIACFEFENDADDTLQMIGQSTELGAPAYVTGTEGSAISFDGDDNLTLAFDADLNVTNLTADMWVNATAPGSGRSGLIDIEAHFGVFLHPGGEVRFGLASSGTITSADTGSGLTDGTWRHVAVRHTPGRGSELYIDGDLVACAAAANPIFTDAEPVMIGANSPNNDSRLVGALDSLRYWGQELPAAEICAAAGKAPGACQELASGCNLP